MWGVFFVTVRLSCHVRRNCQEMARFIFTTKEEGWLKLHIFLSFFKVIPQHIREIPISIRGSPKQRIIGLNGKPLSYG